MSAAYDKLFQKCPECGAQCGPTAERCWMCNALLSASAKRDGGPPLEVPPPTHDRVFGRPAAEDRTDGTSRYLLILLVASLGIIGIGLWTQARGLTLLFLIVVVPALLGLLVSFDRQKKTGESSALVDFLLEAVAGLVKTVAVIVLVLVAIVIAAGVFCFVLFSSSSFR